MNLPHLQTPQPKSNLPVPIGNKTLRALTRPVVTGGRKTYSIENTQFSSYEEIAPIPDPTGSWRTLQTQRKNLLTFPYSQLAKMALDLSPQLDKGRFDFLRFTNPGHILEQPDNPRAEDGAQGFISLLDSYYGSFKTHIDRLWTSIFIYGACGKELVLNESATEPVDIAVINPILFRFRRQAHPTRGTIWQLGQYQNFQFTPFDDDRLVTYLAFDADVDNPYGRPLISPSVYASLTLLMLIDIIQRVFANQGLSRIDYMLEIEQLLTLIDRNPDIAGDDEATAQFINDQIDNIKAVLEGLDVDQDYVHTSAVSVNYGANPNQMNMTGLDVIIKNLQRDVTNGMKSVATLSNVLDSTTETHGQLQLEYYVSALQSFQQELASSLKADFDCANQVRGIPSDLRFEFLKQRTADKSKIAETEKIQTDTIIAKFESGLIDLETAQAEIESMKDELRVQ